MGVRIPPWEPYLNERKAMHLLCLLGHEREYVAVRDTAMQIKCSSSLCCSKMFHLTPCTEARWICKRCGIMREHLATPTGCWKVEFGKLVPDHKAFANWKDKPQVGSMS